VMPFLGAPHTHICTSCRARSDPRFMISAIGAGPINQTIKALSIAREFLYEDNIDLTIQPVKHLSLILVAATCIDVGVLNI